MPLSSFFRLTYNIIIRSATSAIGERDSRLIALPLFILFVSDYHTDSIIQRSLRNELKDVTLITVAHRLQTIMDADKIVRVLQYFALIFLIFIYIHLRWC